jgi:hypothetical protein
MAELATPASGTGSLPKIDTGEAPHGLHGPRGFFYPPSLKVRTSSGEKRTLSQKYGDVEIPFTVSRKKQQHPHRIRQRFLGEPLKKDLFAFP